MKKIALLICILLAMTGNAFGDGLVYFYDGPYRGKVIELETGRPIEGAVVAARWRITVWVHTEILCDAQETITDKNGDFKLPLGWCINHPFAEMDKPRVVVFKPGYLGYPPLGYDQEQRRAHMPDFSGQEFRDKKEFYVIKLGKAKTWDERKSTLDEAVTIIYAEFARKLPLLLKLTNEESKSYWEGPGRQGGPR